MSTETLTDRYVHEVVRRIPADQREDVANELRGTIADTVEARDPADPDGAERAVLTEMGDPIRLAARYAGRPLALIGPEFYPAYIRLLVVLLSTVLPVVTALVVVLDVLDNNDIGSAIGAGIGTVLTVGGQMIAWLTVVFAALDRIRARGDVAIATDRWTPDSLPKHRPPDRKGVHACAALVWDVLLIGLIVWQHTAQPYRAGGTGERLAVLDPALWSGWIWPILLGLAGSALFELLRVVGRGWTVPLATGYAVAQAVFALPLAWILYQEKFFNPDFLALVNGAWTAPDALYSVAALGVLAVSAFEAVKRFRETRG